MPNHPLTEKYGITPGPWEARAVDGFGVLRVYATSGLIATPGHRLDKGEEDANARAIAKVPAMIQALERAIPQLILLGNYIGNEWPGGGGVEAFDRCALIEDVRALLSELDEEAGS